MTNNELIVTKLKTHAFLKSVVPLGSAMPTPPYSVVATEPTDLGYTRVRVTAHFAVGQSVAMETYLRKDVYNLLAYQKLTGVTDRQIRLEPNGIGRVVMSNSDGTISQEAVFLMPEIKY